MQKIPLLVAAGLVGMASAVSAAPVVQTINVDFAGTNRVDFGSTLTAFNGILTSVLLEWDLTAAGGIAALNCTDYADCDVDLVELSIDSDFFAIYDKGTTPTGFNNDTNDAQFTDVTVSINGSLDLTGDAAAFQGAGNLADFLFVSLEHEFYSIPNGIATTGTLTLTYEGSIAAVPLPGSLPLALVGLAGLAVLRRRRQRGAPTA
jgi:opacity protein-like surface antigen